MVPREGCRYGWPARNLRLHPWISEIQNPTMATKMCQNLSRIHFHRRHPGVQKHHMGVNDDPWKQRPVTDVKTEISWNPSQIQNFVQPRSAKIYQKFTPRDVTQAFKSITCVLIMIPESGRPITDVKTEISWNPSKLQNFVSPKSAKMYQNFEPRDVIQACKNITWA